MKARFIDEQIIAMIKEQESGEKTADVCRRHGISSATFYKYKLKYGEMEKSDAKRWFICAKHTVVTSPSLRSLFCCKGEVRDKIAKTVSMSIIE